MKQLKLWEDFINGDFWNEEFGQMTEESKNIISQIQNGTLKEKVYWKIQTSEPQFTYLLKKVKITNFKIVERNGDKIHNKIFQQLNKSFITPFDREDIQKLADTVDDVLDYINGTSQRISLYKPNEFLSIFLDMSNIISDAVKEIETAIVALENITKNKDKIIQCCININTLENKGDDLYHQCIMELFENEKDVPELIKKKEIIETLEKCVDKTEDVADVLKTILIKIS